MTERVDAASKATLEALTDLTGDEVAEVIAGLIGVALMREMKANGGLSAANLMSQISGHASSLGLGARHGQVLAGRPGI